MRYTASPTRPAIAAIAAVLALQTFSATAQTTEPAVSPPADPAPAPAPTEIAPPVIAPAPSVSAPAPATPQVIYQSNGPVVQQVPVNPAPAPAPAPTTTVTPKKAISTPAPKTAAVKEATAPTNAPPAPQSVEPVPVAPATPAAAPADTALMQPAPPAPAVAAEQQDDGTDAGLWLLGIGAVLLAGAGSYAALRRKQPYARDVAQPETMYGYKPVIEQERDAEPFVAVNPADRFKTAEPELVAVKDDPVLESAEEQAVVATPSPLRTAAVSSSTSESDLVSRREALIAEAPSAANPFLTRKNRLRRANFLLARNADELVLEHPATPSVAAQSAQEKSADAVQISYAFGKGDLRPPVLKPRFN